MDQTFADRVLQEFIIEDDRFPYKKYDDFTRIFIDEVSIFSKKNLEKETHFFVSQGSLLRAQTIGLVDKRGKMFIFRQGFFSLSVVLGKWTKKALV